MPTLRHDLDPLNALNGYRERAVGLRDKGTGGLRALAYLESEEGSNRKLVVPWNLDPETNEPPKWCEKWLAMGNKIEAALLLKAQRNLRTPRSDAETRRGCHKSLANKIDQIEIDALIPSEAESSIQEDNYERLDRRIPVLVAANALQVLTSRARTALSAQTMYCYYAILHEFALAMRPDWTIGAARAGNGGNVSAFVTGECMRAISTLERVHRRTASFLARTRELNERFLNLLGIISNIDEKVDFKKPLAQWQPEHPLRLWIDKAIERMWLDWYVSVDNAHGEICFPMPERSSRDITLDSVGKYLRELPQHLKAGIEGIVKQMHLARVEKDKHKEKVELEEAASQADRKTKKTAHSEDRAKRNAREYADLIVDDAVDQAEALMGTVTNYAAQSASLDHMDLLKTLEEQFTAIAVSIHRTLDPSKRFIEGALDRAIAESAAQLDAGELAFAACAYGAATNWQSSSRQHLRRACALLLKSVPESGLLATRRPFHSTPRGYKQFPTSCEIVRSLAVLIEKTQYNLDDAAIAAIGRLLDSIEDQKIGIENDRWYGWNFVGATEQERPSVWVTAVTVLSLDRLVRMLDRRINDMVLSHFEVVQPTKPHSDLGLNDLIYSDYGFARYCPTFNGDGQSPRTPTAITLEEMRAHLVGVPLRRDARRRPAYSAVLYGPPQTGKTTLAEALAFSSGVPLVRLSSFDLTHDPEESIESRGRIIFDALSMLTNAVILFDEFESVLQGREERHELSLEFLLTGLLPKLVKLHTLAGTQGLVYFLATNRIDRIDPAAIRRGRFDLQLAVYMPDTLSRAAACLYRMQLLRNRAKKTWPGAEQTDWTRDAWHLDKHAVIRLLNIVGAATGAPPEELAHTFFALPGGKPFDLKEDSWKIELPCFAHILDGFEPAEGPPQPAEVKELNEPAGATKWIREEVWLNRFERAFQRSLQKQMQHLAGTSGTRSQPASPIDILEACLLPPSSPEN